MASAGHRRRGLTALGVSAALALVLAACSSTESKPSGSSSGGTSSSSTSSVSQATKDATLTAKVKSALAADVGMRTVTGIDVDSEDGVVTLKGKVTSADHKKRAEAVAKKVDGVKKVKNELKVEEPKKS
jgi:hyperosmotically inducible protein